MTSQWAVRQKPSVVQKPGQSTGTPAGSTEMMSARRGSTGSGTHTAAVLLDAVQQAEEFVKFLFIPFDSVVSHRKSMLAVHVQQLFAELVDDPHHSGTLQWTRS